MRWNFTEVEIGNWLEKICYKILCVLWLLSWFKMYSVQTYTHMKEGHLYRKERCGENCIKILQLICDGNIMLY